MKYKLIVSDFDDTIVGDDQIIPSTTVDAIHDYISRGGKFVLSTGRMISAILPHARKLGLHGEVIGYQGSVVADIDTGNFTYEEAVPYEYALEVAEFLEARDIYFHIYENDTFVIKEETEFSKAYRQFTFLPPKIVDKNLSDYIREKHLSPTKILLINYPERVPELLKLIGEKFSDKLLVNSSKRFLVEIVRKETDKGTALVSLAKRLGIDIEEVIAVGDGLNDIPMLLKAGLAVTVQNASSAVKEVANVIAPDCHHEPIKWIIENYCN